MKNILLIVALLTLSGQGWTQEKKKVLFIGNSYTANLPRLVYNIARSVGDTLVYDQHTPGGARFRAHAANATVHSKIKAQQWDFVTLQAQSQEASWSNWQVGNEVFPPAKALCDSVFASNDCVRPMFFMTWGRKNGDAANCSVFPWVCTYAGMDSAIALRYRMMADSNLALLSPVGAVWRYLRTNHAGLELYAGDGSHASAWGAYAAACSFYTVIFRKDPTAITFNSSLSGTDAQVIRQATKAVVYDSLLKWNVGKYDPVAKFTQVKTAGSVQFTNASIGAKQYHWDFGDQKTSSLESPKHTYTKNGTYQVVLVASNCGQTDTSTVSVVVSGISNEGGSTDVTEHGMANQVIVFPNPASNRVTIQAKSSEYFELYTTAGKLLKTGNLEQGSVVVPLTEVPRGSYLLRVGTEYTRLVKH